MWNGLRTCGASVESLTKPLGNSPGTPRAITENNQTTSPRKRRGCFFWGCLSSIFFAVIFIAATGYLGYRILTGQVRQYTDETPAELPAIEYSDADMAALENRLRQTTADERPRQDSSGDAETIPNPSVEEDAARAPGPDDLALSAKDLNALISRNPQLRGKLFVTIENSQLGGEVSVPMEGIPGGEGRFFNASAMFQVELRDHELFVTVTDAYVKDQQAPKLLRDALARGNLAKNINENPRVKERLKKFDAIDVVDDKIIFRATTIPLTEQVDDDTTEDSNEPPADSESD